jgi:hypothetical protein
MEEARTRRTAPSVKPPQSRRGENTGARAGAHVSTDRATTIRAGVVEKKSWPGPLSQKRAAIERGEPKLSVRRQCELLDLSRGSWHYQPTGESEENLRLMRLLDEQYTQTPFYGVKRMTAWLDRQGELANRETGPTVTQNDGLDGLVSWAEDQPTRSYASHLSLSLAGCASHPTRCASGQRTSPTSAWRMGSGIW